MTLALEVSDLRVSFGGLTALDDVSLSVHDGELVGLIGPNGAGKTTLVDAVAGFLRYEGSVRVSGVCVDGDRPDQRAGRGLCRTFQSLELFEDLTVRENVHVGARGSTPDLEAALSATGLSSMGDVLPAELPPSRRRFVALARALAARPRVLLLDEIAAGLDAEERVALVDCLRAVVASGSGALLIDHDLGLVAEVSDRVVVLDGGRVVADGPPGEVGRAEAVLTAYLGRKR